MLEVHPSDHTHDEHRILPTVASETLASVAAPLVKNTTFWRSHLLNIIEFIGQNSSFWCIFWLSNGSNCFEPLHLWIDAHTTVLNKHMNNCCWVVPARIKISESNKKSASSWENQTCLSETIISVWTSGCNFMLLSSGETLTLMDKITYPWHRSIWKLPINCVIVLRHVPCWICFIKDIQIPQTTLRFYILNLWTYHLVTSATPCNPHQNPTSITGEILSWILCC